MIPFALSVGLGVLLCLMGRWLRASSPSTPDPWPEEVASAVSDPEVQPLCHRCLTPHPDEGWFCPVCGAAVGPYNNYMPYLQIFSEGEVLRAGVTDHYRRSALVVTGYVLLSLSTLFIFAPIYWFFLMRHLREQKANDVALAPEAS